jgi:hypothetical protein
MKKIVFTLIAMLSMTTAFAENENAANVNNVESYDMSVSIRKLGVALGLNTDQMEAVETVHNTFNAEMQMAAHYTNKEERQDKVNKAVEKDIKWMNYILTREQYRKYLLLLNTTLNNRGLSK